MPVVCVHARSGTFSTRSLGAATLRHIAQAGRREPRTFSLVPLPLPPHSWMLCFWNFAGVPFLYCAQAVYIHTVKPAVGWGVIIPLTVVLMVTYYFWDTSQSQKNHFRLESECRRAGWAAVSLQASGWATMRPPPRSPRTAGAGTVIERVTFPMLPYATIPNAKHIRTANGSPLLVDGESWRL